MRKIKSPLVDKIIIHNCNMCGKELKIENDILKEDVFNAKKEWGYFSEKDCEIHTFNLCEKCYDELVKSFKLPIVITNKGEVLGN